MQGCEGYADMRAYQEPGYGANDDTRARGFMQLAQLGLRWRAGELDAPLFTALYFLYWQIASQGASWASRKSRRDSKPQYAQYLVALDSLDSDALRASCLDTLQRYAFRAVRPEAAAALRHWLDGQWDLILCTAVPSPHAVLAMQVRGTRPVTVVTEFPAMLAPVHDKANAFHFLIHDLEHAHRFFEDPDSHRYQRRLAEALLIDLEAKHFDAYLNDPLFRAKFEYLIADMNTHVAHALHYLRAILVEFHLRQEGSALDAPLSREAARDIATRIGVLAQAVGLRPEYFERLPRNSLGTKQHAGRP